MLGLGIAPRARSDSAPGPAALRCGRARWGSGTARRRCRASRSGRPTRPSRPRAARRPTRRATPRRAAGRRRSRGAPASTLPVAPALGWGVGRLSHSMKKGSCGSACSPLTPSCFHSSSVPSGRCRLPLTASRPRRASTRADVVDGDDPAEPAAAERGAGAHGLAEGRLVGGGVVEHLDDLEVGAVGQRQDRVAGAEPGMDRPRRRTPRPAGPRGAGSCSPGPPVRRRRRWVETHVAFSHGPTPRAPGLVS